MGEDSEERVEQSVTGMNKGGKWQDLRGATVQKGKSTAIAKGRVGNKKPERRDG